MKGRGRGLLAVVFNDRDKPVGRVEPEVRSPTPSSTGESERVVGPRNSSTDKTEHEHDQVESFTESDEAEKNDSSIATEASTPRAIPRVRSPRSPDPSSAGHRDSVVYKDYTQGHQHAPRFRSRGQNRPTRAHRLNKPGRQEQRKYYQQLDAFLDDHKRDQLQSDVKGMISRNRERTRRQEERIRLSREALDEERKKKMSLKFGVEEKTDKEREDGDQKGARQQEKETRQQDGKVTQMEVDCLRKQLEDVLKRMTIDTYNACKLELLTIVTADGASHSISSPAVVPQPPPIYAMPTSPSGLCYGGQIQYVPVQVLQMPGVVPQMVAVQPMLSSAPVAMATPPQGVAVQSKSQQQGEADRSDKSFSGFKKTPCCAICGSEDHRTHSCSQRDKWFIT